MTKKKTSKHQDLSRLSINNYLTSHLQEIHQIKNAYLSSESFDPSRENSFQGEKQSHCHAAKNILSLVYRQDCRSVDGKPNSNCSNLL